MRKTRCSSRGCGRTRSGSSCSSSSSSRGGFVFLGVGSGSAGLGDVLQGNWSDLFSSSTSNTATIKKDKKLIEQNPKNYEAYKELASAQAADGKVDEAIATLQQLKSVNPKDADGLSQLASMYIRKADEARVGAQIAQAKAQTVVPQSTFAPAPSTDIGKAYQAFSAPVVERPRRQRQRAVPERLLEDDVGVRPGRLRRTRTSRR